MVGSRERTAESKCGGPQEKKASPGLGGGMKTDEPSSNAATSAPVRAIVGRPLPLGACGGTCRCMRAHSGSDPKMQEDKLLLV